MPGKQNIYGWDGSGWVKILVNADGKLIIDPTEIFEDDPTDNELGKAPTSNWAFDHAADTREHLSILTIQGDIITRNATVPKRLAKGTTGYALEAGANEPQWVEHKTLTTGVHGVGAKHVAAFHSAGQEVSKIIWKDVSERVVSDLNRTSPLTWTNLDLTASTSANAKLAIIQLRIIIVSYTSGRIYMAIRKNGTTPSHPPQMEFQVLVALKSMLSTHIIGLDSGQVIEYLLGLTETAEVNFYLEVLGYIE